MNREKAMVERFKKAKEQVAGLKTALVDANKESLEAEQQLLDLLTEQSKERSAKYEGIGYVTVMPPQTFANYKKENEPALFEFLRSNDRGDMIKETVNSKSLSTLVKERIETGETIPECISYFLKTSLRIYDK